MSAKFGLVTGGSSNGYNYSTLEVENIKELWDLVWSKEGLKDLETHGTVGTFDELAEQLSTGVLPNAEYIFYWGGEGLSLLLDGYELSIFDCIPMGTGRV